MSKNVYQKIASVREDLLKIEIPKTGKNDYSKYSYYELDDLIPKITKSCMEHGIICIVTFQKEQAQMKIVNVDNPLDVCIIHSPMPPIEKLNKGTNIMQSLGAYETYQRRYLYVTAFDIIEKEVIELVSENTQKEESNMDNRKEEASDIITQKPEEFTTADKDHKLNADDNVVSMVSEIVESLNEQGVKVDESSILFRAKAMLRRKQIDEKMLGDITSFVKAEA